MQQLFKTTALSVCLFVSILSKLNAQTYVTIPDANFVTWLQSNYPTCMNGNQMDITCAEITSEDSVVVMGMAISNLNGVQHFTNLQVLKCQNNQLTNLPDLPATLTHLICYDNQLTSLPMLPTTLKHLDCSDNFLNNLPILPNLLLRLYCSNNQLTSLPALPTTLLSILCGENQISSLPVLPNFLFQLYCDNNQLTSLPTLPNTISDLQCTHNLLVSLPELPSSLYKLYCNFNQLTSLPTLPSSLTSLHCSDNLLTSLPYLPNSLSNIYCGNNQLTSLPTLPSSLTQLLCHSNHITCFPIFPTSLQDVGSLSTYNNPFTCLPNYVAAMSVQTLAYPLCVDNDFVNNPNGCGVTMGILGSIYKDMDDNCEFTTNDLGLHNIIIKLYNQNDSLLKQTFSAINGIYQFPENADTYILKLDTLNKPFTSQCQNFQLDTNIVLDAQNTLVDSVDFAIACKPGFDIGTQSVLTNGWVFPGENLDFRIVAGDLSQFYNLDCAAGTSGKVEISVSGPVIYQNILPGTLDPIINENIYTYLVPDFGVIDIFTSFGLIFQTDTTAQAGDQICISVSVTPELGDNNPSNNLYEYCYEVVNSYDPNMKEVYPVNVAPGFEDYFTYTIHFQNTGTAPAMNIRLVDTLDANLDLETFQILNYSHYQTANMRGNILTFHFPNIQLPDSTSNLEGSKGYVQYRIKPKANLALGTKIKNTANIYFDYNDPIVTNTTVNEYVLTNSLHENEQVSVKVYPNPFASSTTLAFGQALINTDMHLYNVYGQEVRKISNFSGTKLSLQKENLNAGIYFLQIRNEVHSQKIKLIIIE